MALNDVTGQERGQASLEYVGLVAVVAIALAAMAVLVPRPAHRMLAIVEQALCTGLGRACEIGGEESLALAPCPVRRSTADAAVRATVMSVMVGGGRSALVEERSDGTAALMLADRGQLGVEGGIGATFATDGPSRGARAEASAGLEGGVGRGYEFADVEEALRFLEEHGGSGASLGGVSGCVLCDLAGIGSAGHPEPDFTYLEGGGVVRVGAEGGAGPVGAEGRALAAGAQGRRVDHHSGEVTTYYRVRGDAAADLGGPLAWTGGVGVDSRLEYTAAADGTPLRLMVRSTRSATGRRGLALRGQGRGALVRGAAAHGDLVEEVAILDLDERADREAALAFIESLDSVAGRLELPARAQALGRRLHRAGESEVRRFSMAAAESELSADAALGLKLGGGVERLATARTLTSARTRPAGATLFLDRTDCLD